MAFYIMHDTFIDQKHNQSVLKSETNYGLKNVNNDEKRLNNFEQKLVFKNYERRQTKELDENNKKKRNNEAKTDTTLRNRKETAECENKSFAKKHQRIGDKETSDKENYLPLAVNNQLVNLEKMLNPELKSIEKIEEKCVKEIDLLVNDMNNNKMKEETSKDLIKFSAQEDIAGTKHDIKVTEGITCTKHDIKVTEGITCTKHGIKVTEGITCTKHDIKVTEGITCTKLTILNMESSNPDQNNNIRLKQEIEENLTKNTNKEINEFETVPSDIEQNVNEYVEIMETDYITRKKREKSDRGQIHLEQTVNDNTGELKLEYEEKEEVAYEFEGKGELENEFEETRKVDTEYGETVYEEETKYEVTREEEAEYRGKDNGETEELKTKSKETGGEETEYEETEEVKTEYEETEEIKTLYKETGELDIEYEEIGEAEIEYKETGEVEIVYEEREEVEGYVGTVKIETHRSKTEEVEKNCITNVTDTYPTIDKHIKKRESEEKLFIKTKKNELISQRNIKQKVIEREYEIYKALIIPHKNQEINVEEEFFAKLKGIEENKKKINTENYTKHMKNEITKLEKQDINGHKSLKLKGTHEISPSTEEGQLYWIFLAVSWLPVLLLVSLAFSCFQMIEELENR